jgi:hypothetical protein
MCIFSLWLEECEGKIPQEQKSNFEKKNRCFVEDLVVK